MQTNFTASQLNNLEISSLNEELSACLQCDYCIVNCPTHKLLDNEFDNPRARIYLINEMLASEYAPKKATVKHVDRCLSCLACMSTCPSSVNYMHLVDYARIHIENNYHRPVADRSLRYLLAKILPHPARLRLLIHTVWWLKPLHSILPRKAANLLNTIPRKIPKPSLNDTPQVFPALGKTKKRIVLMTGCVQQVLNTNINNASIEILCRHGCEVIIAKDTNCCGALSYHMGKAEQSYNMAEKNIRAWIKEIDNAGLDAIVINTSGCGTVVKDYGHMFRNKPLAQEAAIVSALTKDISQLLSELDLNYQSVPNLRVAYHATCSLQFGQRIRFLPKKLLKAAGFMILEPKNTYTCCGSAATYQLLQDEISSALKAQKAKDLTVLKADVIATGNIGCMLQIASAIEVPVVHTVELLNWATGGLAPYIVLKKLDKH